MSVARGSEAGPSGSACSRRTTMFEMSADWHARYFDPALAAGITAVKVRSGRTRPPTSS